MRSTWAGSSVVLALACAGLWSSSSQARAEDPVERAATTWRFDIRVVRLTTPHATVEQAPALPGMTPIGVSTATWAELLTALKARGTTQILMDRNVTTLPDRTARANQSWVRNVMTTERATGAVVERRASPAMSSIDSELMLDGGTGRLEYALNIRWTDLSGQAEPVSIHTSWSGTQLLQGDGTLVLRNADQERAPSGGTELYVLITWDAP